MTHYKFTITGIIDAGSPEEVEETIYNQLRASTTGKIYITVAEPTGKVILETHSQEP